MRRTDPPMHKTAEVDWHHEQMCTTELCGGSPLRPPETPVERLRRLADPKTRNVPPSVILEAVALVVSDLVDDVAVQRQQMTEQRDWIVATCRKNGLTMEGEPMHERGKPIPTPNRPDQTPQEQRPEAVLGEVPLIPECKRYASNVVHPVHGDCPGVDGNK